MTETTPTAYTYQAEILCAHCAAHVAADRIHGTEDGLLTAATAEAAIRAHMTAHGVDMDDPHTYDSDQYPKPADPEYMALLETCAKCGEAVGYYEAAALISDADERGAYTGTHALRRLLEMFPGQDDDRLREALASVDEDGGAAYSAIEDATWITDDGEALRTYFDDNGSIWLCRQVTPSGHLPEGGIQQCAVLTNAEDEVIEAYALTEGGMQAACVDVAEELSNEDTELADAVLGNVPRGLGVQGTLEALATSLRYEGAPLSLRITYHSDDIRPVDW